MFESGAYDNVCFYVINVIYKIYTYRSSPIVR